MKEVTRRLRVARGVELTYRLWRAADQQRPLLLLVHGLASNLTRWSEFVEQTTLRRSWDILRVDLRGHGRSMCRCRLRTEVWCRDLLALLDAEGYSAAVLVGHSLGAQIAIHFAHRHSARVRGLVLIDPLLGRPSTPLLRWGRVLSPLLRLTSATIRLLNRLGLRRRELPWRDLQELDESTREKLLDAGRIDEMVRRYRSPWPDLKHSPTANFLDSSVEMARPLPPLSEITAPVLVLLSKRGTYADAARTREAIEGFVQATTIAVDAYHWPLTERPRETRQAIEAWCRTLYAPYGLSE